MTKQNHIPVLLDAVIECLSPQKGDSYLDLTAGYGGHALAVLEKTKNPNEAVLVDRDVDAVNALRKQFVSIKALNSDFVSALSSLVADGQMFDLVLADLGVSSPHLDDVSRGFSFLGSGTLDMRMDQSQGLDATTIANDYSEKELSKILFEYGEEPKAREIARKIVQKRPIKSASELADIAKSAWPGRSKVHPATRTFQAFRIAVNDELNQLTAALPLILRVLKPGGRLAIISFHSLEDRIVKDFYKDNSEGYDAQLEIITKKPLLATKTEIVNNPRARSAKLRAAVKINTKTERK